MVTMAHITALNYFTVRITLLVCVHCVVVFFSILQSRNNQNQWSYCIWNLRRRIAFTWRKKIYPVFL